MTQNEPKTNRIYKARMFEMIFSEKKELLELYNAMNGTEYEDPELLEINTLENAIYMSMRNDLSFLIDSRVFLYEHQSTYNPNLPIAMAVERAEAIKVSIFEYDEEEHMRMEREEHERIGEERGRQIGIEFAKKIFVLNRSGKTDEEIAEACGISVERVKEILY